MKMAHITIIFHINLYANKIYLIDVDPPPETIDTKFLNPGKYTG